METEERKDVRGKVKLASSPPIGSVLKVVSQIPHRFCRFLAEDFVSSTESRLQFFYDEILPKIISSAQHHVLIFIPSYFDFIQIRNTLRDRFVDFLSISEFVPLSLSFSLFIIIIRSSLSLFPSSDHLFFFLSAAK